MSVRIIHLKIFEYVFRTLTPAFIHVFHVVFVVIFRYSVSSSLSDVNNYHDTYHDVFRMGEILVELYWKHAPITCRNFAELVRRGYYNGTKFHRIIRDFMIQGQCCEPLYTVKPQFEVLTHQ